MNLYKAKELMEGEPYLQFFNKKTKRFYHYSISGIFVYTTDAVIRNTSYFTVRDEIPKKGWIKLNNIKGK